MVVEASSWHANDPLVVADMEVGVSVEMTATVME